MPKPAPKGSLTREVGPKDFKLPVWGWLAVAVGGYILYKRYAASQDATIAQQATASGGAGAGGRGSGHGGVPPHRHRYGRRPWPVQGYY